MSDITVYTDLLETALKVADDMDKISTEPYDKQEWKWLRRVCRKELYYVNRGIKWKKHLTKKQGS